MEQVPGTSPAPFKANDVLSEAYLAQFARDHLEELWDELEDFIQEIGPGVHRINGEDFPDLEPDEQISLLKEAATLLGVQNPLNKDLLESYSAIVSHLGFSEDIKRELLLLPSDVSNPPTEHLK